MKGYGGKGGSLPDAPKNNKTVTFREDVKGWVSFKSFTPENAISCANEYYTFNLGKIWQHHSEGEDRNTFYGVPGISTFNVILNDVPGSVKSFNTINYEGSQSKVDQFLIDSTTGLSDGEYYNLHTKKGWYVDSIFTNKETGTINEFIEKEGKWFNYIKGQDIQHVDQAVLINPDGSSTFDQASFAIQGLGTLQFSPIEVTVSGCTDPYASNYNEDAPIDDGSCIPFTYGCTEPSANNYNSTENTDDGSCIWFGCVCNSSVYPNGCTDPFEFPPIAYNYSINNNIIDDGSCIATIYGCTDPAALNYDPYANTDDLSCIAVVNGCMIELSDNYNPLANTDDGSCTWLGCTELLASNYGWFGWGQSGSGGTGFPGAASTYMVSGPQYGIQNDAAACEGGGCTDATADNYDVLALYDPLPGNGSCLYCDWDIALGAYDGIPITATTLDTSPGNSTGQLAVYSNPTAPYLPYSFELIHSSGGTYTTYYPGQTLNGIPQSNSVLFSGLPAGIYNVVIQGANGICSYTLGDIAISESVVAAVFGCTDVNACNYDAGADTDNFSCEFTTCVGCTDILANNQGLQTGTSTNCVMPGTNQDGPCSTPCNLNVDNDCCTYIVYGCTDPIACNYDAAANNDDGSCTYSGCTDPTALNYLACATINNGSCTYAPDEGCTDPYACNYDADAIIDDNTCMYGFNGATIGDPTLRDINNNPVAIPAYYHPGPIPHSNDKAQHYVQSTGIPHNTTLISETDIGLAIQHVTDNMSEYQGTGTVTINVRMQPNVGSTWNIIHTKTIGTHPSDGWSYGSAGSGATWGGRASSAAGPYPWGPSSTSGVNVAWPVFIPLSLIRQNYALEIYSTVNGVHYGKYNGTTPTCGIYNAFNFNPQTLCSNAFSVLGCTDTLACNYDPLATCDDSSCYYGTAQFWECGAAGFGCTECAGCSGPCGGVFYTSEADCNAVCGASITQGPSTILADGY